MNGPTIRALNFWIVCLTIVSPDLAWAADSFALRAGRIYPVAPGMPRVLENGLIVVRDGQIEAIGTDIPVPPDLPLLERPDAVVVPGFVAAMTELGARHRGDESVAAGYHAVDAFDRYGNFATTLAGGVTTVHLSPGEHRLLTGQGAVVKLAGSPVERVLIDRADLSVNLGTDVNSPPRDVTFSFPASSDVVIPVPAEQRPRSRMGQLLAIDEELAAARATRSASTNSAGYFILHRQALREAWDGGRVLRIRADAPADLLGAIDYLAARGRRGYLVGGASAHRIADRLRAGRIPLVYRPSSRFRGSGRDIGTHPDALSTEYGDLARLTGLPLAFGVPRGESTSRLRLVAVAARGAGVDADLALAAITRIPAEILGVADRVGSLQVGLDADLVVLSDGPLEVSSHVLEVFVNGASVYAQSKGDALVVRGGTVWASPDRTIVDGEILIENGKIVAVGQSVPHPPHARVIDAGPDAFITPGFIDARGHLGMQGDRGAAGPNVDLTRLVGVPDVTHKRVALAGITTVLMSPYQFSGRGSRLTAVKTAGRARADRVVRDTAAIAFTVTGKDPSTVKSSIRRVIDAGRKYLEKWKKYEKDLAEYLEKTKKGEATEEKETVEQEEIETVEADPVTGTWEINPTSGPVPLGETAKIALRLDGSRVEGRIVEPVPPVDVRIVMTFDGGKLTGTIEVDEELPGVPQIEAEIYEEDKVKGSISMLDQAVEFEGTRIDKTEVEFKVTRKRQRRGGKPEAPKLDPALEPVRALLEKKIVAAIQVSTAAEIREVLELFVDELKLPVILLGANGIHPHLERLAKDKVGVVLPRDIVQRRKRQEVNLGDQLARHGVPIAFQSRAEDGARDLPYHVLYAVERGLSADAALTALTLGAARMYKLEDRIGTLAAGKDGDLLIFRGHPFRDGVRVERVIINGKEVNS